MPILDPVYFSALISETESKNSKYSKHFFLHYLRIASKNLYRNSQTIEASIQFKKDLKSSIKEINRLFGCKFTQESEFDDPTIKDYYRFLYDHIDSKYKENLLKNQKGYYKVIYEDFKTNYFQPFIDLPDSRSWVFTTSPNVILIIDEGSRYEKIHFKLTNLEIDLMHAAGFQIVLCVKMDLDEGVYKMLFEETLSTHKFAEIHFFVQRDEDTRPNSLDNFFGSLLNIYDKIDGYFYLYSQFVLDKESEASKAIKKLKSKPRFRGFFTSNNTYYSIKSLISEKTKPFVYCKTGFDDDNLQLFLCNIPLYKTADYREDFLATEYSGNSIGYISKNDFFNCTNTRVKIIFADLKNNGKHIVRYIDADDIHYIKSDMYVDETIETINDISSNIVDKVYDHDTFKKEIFFSFFKEKRKKDDQWFNLCLLCLC